MMITIAMWHYPQRTTIENVHYFAKQGLSILSLLGDQLESACKEDGGAALAEALRQNHITVTVHSRLPRNHTPEEVAKFHTRIELFAAWQATYGYILNLTFDVPQPIRDNITPYIDETLATVLNCKIGVEDFGLTEAEYAQIAHLKGNDRFGYLLDFGHLYIRMNGKYTGHETLFHNSPNECPPTDAPTQADFLRALRSKPFPIIECHIHNNDGVRDLHQFLPCGTMNMEAVAQAMKAFGFSGVMTIESAPNCVFTCPYDEADRRIMEDVAIWGKLYR